MRASVEPRIERLAPWAAGALMALPVLIARYPPMADLPLHEAVIGLLRHWGDPAYVPANVYELNIGQSNQLFYFLILPFTYVLGVSLAAKACLAATMLLLPVAFARTADHLGVSRWLAVIVSPLCIGWMFFWGLFANLVGLTVFFFALPTLDRFVRSPSLRGLLAACGWMVVEHFAHDSTALFAAGAVIVFTVCAWDGMARSLVRLIPPAVAVGLAFQSRRSAIQLAEVRGEGAPAFQWSSFPHKLATIPGVIHGGFDAPIRNLMFVVCLVPTLLFAIERWRNHGPLAGTWRERLWHFRFEIVGLGLLLGYFAAPATVGSTTLVYHRFLAPAWVILVLCCGTRASQITPWRLPRLLSSLTPLVPLLAAWPQFVDSDRTYRQLDACIAHMRPGTSYLGLDLGPEEPDLLYRPITGMGHVVANLGGRTLFDSTTSPAAPVYMRPPAVWSHIFNRVDQHSYRSMPAFDLTRFQYVLLHTKEGSLDLVISRALEPFATFVFHSGEWTLLESKLPQLPLDQPDSLVPLPHPPTLRKLGLAVVEAMNPNAPANALPEESPAPAPP